MSASVVIAAVVFSDHEKYVGRCGGLVNNVAMAVLFAGRDKAKAEVKAKWSQYKVTYYEASV